MKQKTKRNIKNMNYKSIELSFYYMFAGWTIIIISIVLISFLQMKEETYHLAYTEAHKSHEKDLTFREWATQHGGVYVPVDSITQPNKYLKADSREITIPSGKEYTLMNPAFMTRQLNELSYQKYLIIGHITSLNPIRPANQPDDWEIIALKQFEKGTKEYFGIDTINNEKYYRYMAPLVTQQGCLKCHAAQGYKVGDIRGGISTAVPWGKYQIIINTQLNNLLFGYGTLWIIGMVGINFFRKKFSIYIVEKEKSIQYQEDLLKELKNSNNEIEKALNQKSKLIMELFETQKELTLINSQKDKLFSIIAHDIKSPFNGFLNLSRMMADKSYDHTLDEMIELSTHLRDTAENTYSLIENLLEWSRMQKGEISYEPENLLFKMTIDGIYKLNKVSASNKKIMLVNKVPENLTIFADIQMINTIFRNLISNAIKFTHIGGEIEIGTIPLSPPFTKQG